MAATEVDASGPALVRTVVSPFLRWAIGPAAANRTPLLPARNLAEYYNQ